jgi:regulator of cell morphogenesis and NO signaling
MDQLHRSFIRPESKLALLLNENPFLILLLEYMEADFAVGEKSVSTLCKEYRIDLPSFLVIANLYNGFNPGKPEIDAIENISTIIRYLKNSHKYYKYSKYPEIKELISQLHDQDNKEVILLTEKFFNDYFLEVQEHLTYEDEIVFPYMCRLMSGDTAGVGDNFSVREYRDHHSDIETKLADLKNLLLKHLTIKGKVETRRNILFSLFMLEADLLLHSRVEEMVLLPLAEKLEKSLRNGQKQG